MGEGNKDQNTGNHTVKELTRDELKNAVDQLQQQNKFLIAELQKHAGEDFFKRIEYLFKVIENKDLFIAVDNEFFNEAVKDLISILRIDKTQPVNTNAKAE